VIIGVHTPEFGFERDMANVRQAIASLGVSYPVALDSDYAIWRAFDNEAWPAFYFIGADGRARRQVFGEGGYDQSERLIQRLLTEANAAPLTSDITIARGDGAQAEADFSDLRSPETYIGYAKASNFVSAGGVREDAPNFYRPTSALRPNHWSLDGAWTIGGEYAALNQAHGRISYRFHARDLHLVMAPPSPGGSVRFQVKIDGAPPGADHGFDVNAEGRGSVHDARLYQLVRQTRPVTDRTFEIEFIDPGVRAYVFTFG
jgi:hypothetical protein